MQENNRTEYKRELNDRLERAVVSFLNYPGGGEVIIGVDDNGDAVGIKFVDLINVVKVCTGQIVPIRLLKGQEIG